MARYIAVFLMLVCFAGAIYNLGTNDLRWALFDFIGGVIALYIALDLEVES